MLIENVSITKTYQDKAFVRFFGILKPCISSLGIVPQQQHDVQ